jgi:thymidylate kinase
MYKNQYTGKFIAFEGLDGAGSTTQAEKPAGFEPAGG